MDLTKLEKELEAEADSLLELAGMDLEYPAYPERKMIRRVSRHEKGIDTALLYGEDPSDPMAGLLMALIDEILESLSLKKRDAEALRLFLLGRNQTEIAKMLGISQQAVAKRLDRIIFCGDRKRNSAPHAGWYQVYLEEVHRTVYRKPSHNRRSGIRQEPVIQPDSPPR